MNDVGFRLYATDEVSGPAGRARSSLLSLGKDASTVSGGLGKIGQGALTAAKNLALLAVPAVLALGAVATSSTNAARQFQSDMTLIQTQAGASADEVTNMSAAVLKLAPAVGTGPDALAAGLYHVESAGVRGAKALDLLTIAAEGAKVGHADLESVTNALIASEQSGVKGVEDMSQAMGTLNAIVGAGNMRMQDLADAMGTGVLSTAKNYGVSLQSVGAALADMTDQGIPAVDAATRLNSAMRLMAAPTATAAKDLKSIGLSSTQLAADMRSPGGMLTAIQDLKSHLDASGLSEIQQAALLSQAFGGKQSGAILTLIGNVDLLKQKTDAVAQGAGEFSSAWEATGQTVAEQQANLSASIDALKIQFGTELLPVEQRVVTALAKLAASPEVQSAITSLGDAIAGMFSQQNIDLATTFVDGIVPKIGDFASTVLPPLIDGLRIAGQVTKEAFDLFSQLPEPLQAAIIGGLAVNKLSGGLVGSGLTDILKAATGKGGGGAGIASVLGGVQHVWVDNMGVGGLGGGLGGAAGAAAGGGEGAAGTGSVVGDLIAGGGSVGLGGAALAVAAILGSAVVVSAAGDLVTAVAGKQQYGQEFTDPLTGQKRWNIDPNRNGGAQYTTFAPTDPRSPLYVPPVIPAPAKPTASWYMPGGGKTSADIESAKYTHELAAASGSLDSAVRDWRNSNTSVASTATSLDDAVRNWRSQPAPIVNVTVNTDIAVSDITRKTTTRSFVASERAV